MYQSGKLFAELVSRFRAHGSDIHAIAREAQAILDRHEAEARDVADRLIVDARIEAARLITDARREAALITERAAAVQQAYQDAALALEHSRRALEASVGAAGTFRPATSGSESRSSIGSDLRPPLTNWPVPELQRGGPSPTRPAAKSTALPRRVRSRRVLPVTIGAAVLATVLTAAWFGRTLLPSTTGMPSSAAGTSENSLARPDGTSGRLEPDARPGALTVVLEARRPAWVRATRDGRSEAGSTLQAGQRRRLTASERLAIRAGDGGALTISVNGGLASPFGRDGQPLTREFNARPLRSAAAAPPAAQSAPPSSAAPVLQTAPVMPPPVSGPSPSAESTEVVRRPPGNPEQEILQTDRQWFDSFYRGDRPTLARLSAPGFEIVDSRTIAERGWTSGAPPERALTNVRIDVHGDGAVLSARMTERIAAGAAGVRESYISEVWVRRDGVWQLLGVRLAGSSEVRQAADSLR